MDIIYVPFLIVGYAVVSFGTYLLLLMMTLFNRSSHIPMWRLYVWAVFWPVTWLYIFSIGIWETLEFNYHELKNRKDK